MRIGHDSVPQRGDEKLDREIVENEIAKDSVDKKAAGIIHNEVRDMPTLEEKAKKQLETMMRREWEEVKRQAGGAVKKLESEWSPLGGYEAKTIWDYNLRRIEMIWRDPVTKQIVGEQNVAIYDSLPATYQAMLDALLVLDKPPGGKREQ